MSDGDVCRLRVHQFAKLRGVSVDTVYLWRDQGKITVERDEGGWRLWVIVKKYIPNPTERVGNLPNRPM